MSHCFISGCICHNKLHLYSLFDSHLTHWKEFCICSKELDDKNKHDGQGAPAVWTFYLMSSSVTTKALHRGCAVLSQTPGFFSTAAVSCPVTGAGLVCSALAMAESSVLSELAGPTPTQRTTRKQKSSFLKKKKNSFESYKVVISFGKSHPVSL